METTAFSPAWPGYLADPFVWDHDGVYYAVGTGGAEAGGAFSERVIPLLRSADLRTWEFVHNALVRPDATLGGQFWAPAVARGDDGRFYLYYSVGDCNTGKDHQLRVAVADRPEGPYADTRVPLLVPDSEEVFVFDPHPFRDDDGRWYLFYNRNYLNAEGDDRRAGDAIAARPLIGMTRVGESVSIVRPSADWQRCPSRRYGDRVIDWHCTEGACVVKRHGRYWCFFSGSAWHTANYGVDFAVADTVLGPYDTAATGSEISPRILRARSDLEGLRGPGHNSIVVGPDGVTDYIVFHAWDTDMAKRQMYIEPLVWTANGPRLARTRAMAAV